MIVPGTVVAPVVIPATAVVPAIIAMIITPTIPMAIVAVVVSAGIPAAIVPVTPVVAAVVAGVMSAAVVIAMIRPMLLMAAVVVSCAMERRGHNRSRHGRRAGDERYQKGSDRRAFHDRLLVELPFKADAAMKRGAGLFRNDDEGTLNATFRIRSFFWNRGAVDWHSARGPLWYRSGPGRAADPPK